MNKRRIVLYCISLLLLTGGIALCVIRWKAWFGNPTEPVWERDTIPFHFHTFAQDSVPGFARADRSWFDLYEPDELVFLLLGDVHNGVDSMQWEDIYKRHPQVDFYAQLGDFIERGYFYYAQQMVSELEGTPFENLPIVTTPGNHEYRKGVVRRLPKLWYELFEQPANGPQRFQGTTYYVDFARLRLIVIDTNGLQRLSDFTRVNTWVRQTIQNADGRFTVVMMHHPVYSSAKGRQNLLIRCAFARVLREADVVFSGHDHNYARHLPFIGTNSARKFYKTKNHLMAESVCSGKQLYEVVTVKQDTLTVQTYLMESGELFDEVHVTRPPVVNR